MNNTWTEEIVLAFSKLGGTASNKELENYFKENNLKDYNLKKDGSANIRAAVESHSSDSEVFQKKSENYKNNPDNDLFISLNGIGKGFWGLRSFISKNKVDPSVTTIFKDGKKTRVYTNKYERNPA